MGQYFKILNLDKKEYMMNHDFGGGIKLVEHGGLILECLAFLLAENNGRGGGSLNSNHPIIGSWAGDRIIFASDYGDPYAPLGRPKPVWNERKQSWENGEEVEGDNLYTISRSWRNVVYDIMLAISEDSWYKSHLRSVIGDYRKQGFYPNVAVDFAIAYKNYDSDPVFGEMASEFFRKLFPENTDYYRTINGIIKHHVKNR